MEEQLLLGIQEVVAPGDGGTQRPLPLRGVPLGRPWQVEALFESLRDRYRAEQVHPGCGDLDAQG